MMYNQTFMNHGTTMIHFNTIDQHAPVGYKGASKRILQDNPEKNKAIMNSHDAVDAGPYLSELDHEELWVLFLNGANHPIECRMMTSGGWDSTVIDPRQILKEALLLHASAIIIFHNHPCGDPTPGTADIRQTERLRDASHVLGIPLVDHIIIGDGCFYSFSDEAVTFT